MMDLFHKLACASGFLEYSSKGGGIMSSNSSGTTLEANTQHLSSIHHYFLKAARIFVNVISFHLFVPGSSPNFPQPPTPKPEEMLKLQQLSRWPHGAPGAFVGRFRIKICGNQKNLPVCSSSGVKIFIDFDGS